MISSVFPLLLQALAGASGHAESAVACATAAQERLHDSPWELLHAAEALNSESLSPSALAAQERCRQLSMQLGSASNERMLHGLLPRSAVSAFVATDSSSESARAQQMAALKEVIFPNQHAQSNCLDDMSYALLPLSDDEAYQNRVGYMAIKSICIQHAEQLVLTIMLCKTSPPFE